MFMFCIDDQLGKNVGCHVICPDEFEHDWSVNDAFPNVMVSDVDVFGHGMIDRVPSKKVHSMVVNV